MRRRIVVEVAVGLVVLGASWIWFGGPRVGPFFGLIVAMVLWRRYVVND
jgi:hypothetical protein